MIKLKDEIASQSLENLIDIDMYTGWNKIKRKDYKKYLLILFIFFVLPITGVSGMISGVMILMNSRLPESAISMKFVYVGIPILIYLLISIIYYFCCSILLFDTNRIKSMYLLRKGFEYNFYMAFVLLFMIGILGIFIAFIDLQLFWVVDVLVFILIPLNVWMMYLFYVKGIHTFLNKSYSHNMIGKMGKLVKKGWPFLGLLALISFVTAPSTRDFREKIYLAVSPFILVLMFPLSYLYFDGIRKNYYIISVFYLFPEECRNLLGESEVDFYGKNYMKSKSVMRKIETYKQSKND